MTQGGPRRVLEGRYELRATLGAGGMGQVWRAYDHELGRAVAIKLLLDGTDARPETVARFRREAQAVAALKSNHIVDIYDFRAAGGTPFLVLELLEGETLAERIRRRGRLELNEAMGVLSQIASALQVAHDAGIVHRDLKPSNIFVCQRTPHQGEVVKLLDFGIAKLARPGPTAQGYGTPGFMSPEQEAARRPVDHRSDLFSLGLVAYEMLTGKQALPSEPDPDTGSRSSVPSLRDSAPHLPPAVDHWLGKACSEDPDQRFASAYEMSNALHLAARSPSVPGRRSIPPVHVPGADAVSLHTLTSRPSPPSASHARWAIPVVLVAGIAGAWLVGRRQPTPMPEPALVCVPPAADCNQTKADGCETNLSGDARNCGACGVGCVAGHGTARCEAGTCVLQCSPGFARCAGARTCDTSLDEDAAHCGRCGHDCLGGACKAGICQPVALASRQPLPVSLGFAPDDTTKTHVYWLNRGSSDHASGSIVRGQRRGGASTELAGKLNFPRALTVDRTDVYFTSQTPPAVFRVPSTGGRAPVSMVGFESGAPYRMATDKASVYFSNSESGEVRAFPKKGGQARTLASGVGRGGRIVAHNDSVFVVDEGSGESDGRILRIYKQGSDPVVVASGQSSPTGLDTCIAEKSLFWSNRTEDGTIMTAPMNASDEPPAVFASGQEFPAGLTVDNGVVFWVLEIADGAVMAAPVAGGAPVAIATGQRFPTVVIADDVAVYWANRGTGDDDGAVMRVAR